VIETKKESLRFKCKLIKAKALPEKELKEINKWRNKLHEIGFIRAEKGVCLGNISCRRKKGFIITGTRTAKFKELKPEQYCQVIEFNPKKKLLVCKGKINASSESLTHAAIYSSNKKINAVIHAHNTKMWKALKKKVPCTRKEIKQGTAEMAEEMKKLMKQENTLKKKIIVMKGHKGGLISFGKNLNEAGNVLLNYLNGIQSSEFPKNLAEFLKQEKLKLIKKVSKGFSSEIFLVKKGKKNFALKIEKIKSRRKEMAKKEAENLKKANSVGVGPLIYGYDLQKKIILMEYIKGKTFSEWLSEMKKNKNNKRKLKKFIKELIKQAEKLDEIGLDHGQLAGRGVNILVKKNLPVIIDFEKASSKRKAHNKKVLESFLFKNPHSEITKKIKEILNLK
jgi:predicted Ser/Thr protein kinase